ncbi:MAG: DNA-3-methyladenine glycosylase family protein [Gammaproteobacteria bacterium]
MESASFDVKLAGPLDIPASVERFRSAGDDGLDRWDGTHLIRTMRTGTRAVPYVCAVAGTVGRPALRVTVAEPAHGTEIQCALRASFVTAPPDFKELLRTDPVIARLDAQFRGVRPVLHFDLLAALVRCISAQQVNLRWAAITRRRLAEAFGDRHVIDGHEVYSLSAQRLAAASVAEIRALQFTTRKAQYIIGIAQAIAAGRLKMAELAELPDEEIISRLITLRGIGLWTAEWILARTLGRPRVVAGDLGVRKAVGLAYLNSAAPSEQEVRRAIAHWGASASVAQTLLLHALHENRLNPPAA